VRVSEAIYFLFSREKWNFDQLLQVMNEVIGDEKQKTETRICC
jgi:hypothetical protein